MASAKLLKIDSSGFNIENAVTDDITFGSYTVQGGPVLGTNLDMNGGSVSDINAISFTDASSGGISFPSITDSAGELDLFRLPSLAGVPTATPTNGEPSVVWDSSNNKLMIWDGAAWNNSFVAATSTPAVIDTANYVAITGGLSARDCVYISASGEVGKADASAESTARVIGFVTNSPSGGAAANVQEVGVLSGFSGLTVGAPYFLSETAAAVTATPPTTSGAQIVLVGYAATSAKLNIQIQKLGIRA